MEANDLSQSGDLAETYIAKIAAAYRDELAGHERQVGRIVEVGRLILEAKEAVGHGNFTEYVLEKLPFGMNKAQRRMKIAECPELANTVTGRFCRPPPARWSPSRGSMTRSSRARWHDGSGAN